MKRLITFLLAVLVLAAIYASVDPRQLAAVFVRSDVRWLAASLAMFLPTMLCTAWRLKVLTPPPARIDLAEATRLTAVAASLNVILPSKMGDIVKGIFIARRGHLSRALALNLTTFEKACDLLALLAWCVLGLVLIGERGQLIWSIALIVGGALAFGTLALTTPLLDGLLRRAAATLPVLRRHTGKSHLFADGWAQMRRANIRRPWRALAVAAISLGIWLLHLIQIWMFSEALGGGVPLVDSLALTPLAILVGLLPLTPAGIGTRDAALIYFYRGYFDAATGAALGLLCTLRYVVPAVAGLPWLRAGWAMHRAAVAEGAAAQPERLPTGTAAQ